MHIHIVCSKNRGSAITYLNILISCYIIILGSFSPHDDQGLIARHEGSPAEAIKYFKRAIELNSTSSEYYREIAKTL